MKATMIRSLHGEVKHCYLHGRTAYMLKAYVIQRQENHALTKDLVPSLKYDLIYSPNHVLLLWLLFLTFCVILYYHYHKYIFYLWNFMSEMKYSYSYSYSSLLDY